VIIQTLMDYLEESIRLCNALHIIKLYAFPQSTINLLLKMFTMWTSIYSILSCMRVYPKVSGLAAWSENCKWYSSLPLDAAVLLFCESV
jgi:hypothetical protein